MYMSSGFITFLRPVYGSFSKPTGGNIFFLCVFPLFYFSFSFFHSFVLPSLADLCDILKLNIYDYFSHNTFWTTWKIIRFDKFKYKTNKKPMLTNNLGKEFFFVNGKNWLVDLKYTEFLPVETNGLRSNKRNYFIINCQKFTGILFLVMLEMMRCRRRSNSGKQASGNFPRICFTFRQTGHDEYTHSTHSQIISRYFFRSANVVWRLTQKRFAHSYTDAINSA